jgi:hypothetical protein
MGEAYDDLSDLLKGTYTKQALVVGTACGELRGQIVDANHIHKTYFCLTGDQGEDDLILVNLDSVAWIRTKDR